MEEDATCSLCMEVFTDPVSLPCGHGFCRGCLRAVVSHNSGMKTGEDTSSDSAILSCPLCRTEVTLGPSGVDELQGLSNVKDSAETALLCDMCESDNRKAAHYCTNCVTLYCKQCLGVMHPPRGPLRRHRLMSMEQYMSEQSTHEADLKTDCKEHGEPLSLFCGTCEVLICTRCVPGHDDHVIQKVSTAFTRNKGPLEDQVDRCRAIKTELETLQAALIATQKDIQTKAEEEFKGIEANYEHTLKSLQAWRKSEREKVGDRRDKRTSESLSQLKNINMMLEETDRLMMSSAELLAGNQALFLLESKELLERLKCNSSESNQELEEKRQKMTELRSALSRCEFRPCILTSLHAPQLKFTEASEPEAVIIEDMGITARDKPGDSASNICVRTDGLISHPHYWEVAITWGVSSPPEPGKWWLVCSVGVRQEGSDFGSRPGGDPTSYAVEIGYNKDEHGYRFYCMHQKKEEFQSAVQSLQAESVTNRFGFLLQTPERTLAVIDLATETRLRKFRGLDVSRPFVPVVWFGTDDFHRSFRLIPADSSMSIKRVGYLTS